MLTERHHKWSKLMKKANPDLQNNKYNREKPGETTSII